jgi:osmoprotectant transport system ATP-binding protein
VSDIELGDWPVAQAGTGRQALREQLQRSDKDWVLLLDEQRRPLRWYSARDLDRPEALEDVGLPATSLVEPNATLHDALDLMITSYSGAVIVVDGHGGYQGIVELDAIRHRVDEVRRAAREHARMESGAAAETAGGAHAAGKAEAQAPR